MSRYRTTVYLLHFHSPFGHAKHYTGYTTNLDNRIAAHRAGTGANLTAKCVQAGIGFDVVRTWTIEGRTKREAAQKGRAKEIALKKSGSASRYCPRCKALKQANHIASETE